MALSTHRKCVPRTEKALCPPKRLHCPGGAAPGFCLNAQCSNCVRHEVMHGRSAVEKEAEIHRQCIEKAIKENRKKERGEFLASERKIWGMKEPLQDEINNRESLYKKDSDLQEKDGLACPPISLKELKMAQGGEKTMRPPARPLCMLEVPAYVPPTDDYTELSRFLRVSTMPGYSKNDTISEYHDNHNMAVWNNRKELDKQIYKMKRDWLSVWGEFNVIEQRWRKAWVEKFGAGVVKK